MGVFPAIAGWFLGKYPMWVMTGGIIDGNFHLIIYGRVCGRNGGMYGCIWKYGDVLFPDKPESMCTKVYAYAVEPRGRVAKSIN